MNGGVLVLVSLASLGYGLGATTWRVWRRRAWRGPFVRLMLVRAAVLLSQFFEALPDWLENSHVPTVPDRVARICLALELPCPSLLVYAVWRGSGLPLG